MTAYVPHPVGLMPGDKIGDWIIRKRLGSGSFGTVFQVECEAVLFALKFSLRRLDSEDLNHTAARLQKELACLLQIRHPNIVRTYAYGHWPHPANGYPYLVMDYVEGPTLHQWRQRAVPTFRQVLELFCQLALTMDALDHAQIRHRDLKGSNILVRASDGEPVLVDFGSADYEHSLRLTEGPLPPGTPHYRSPESLRFQRENIRRPEAHYLFQLTDDLYSLGVTLYELLAGCAPFSPELPREVLYIEIERKQPRSPALFDGRIPEALSQLVLRMLAKKPEQRPQSGQEVYDALQALLREGGPLLDERLFVQHLEAPPTELELAQEVRGPT